MKIESAIAANRFGLGARPGELMQHLHLQEQFLDQSVFPDAKPVPVIDGLVDTLA